MLATMLIDDHRHPSLSIADCVDGGLSLRCFAACSWGAIRDALRPRPLWPEPRTRTRAHQTDRKARDPLDAAGRCLVWEPS
jgi:hypothetical protein